MVPNSSTKISFCLPPILLDVGVDYDDQGPTPVVPLLPSPHRHDLDSPEEMLSHSSCLCMWS